MSVVEASGVISSEALQRIPIVDIDSHLQEPPDLWTSRLPGKWQEDAPQLVFDSETGIERWRVGDRMIVGVGNYSLAGWREWWPNHPSRFEELDTGSWDPAVRLQRLDEYGIYSQFLYSNLLGFHGWAFQRLDPELRLACVRVYNDFQHEFCAQDPARLLPLIHLPYWSVEESVAELERCHALGFRGINFGWRLERMGLPPLRDEHWNPLLSTAQDMGLPINFHIGFQLRTEDESLDRIARRFDDRHMSVLEDARSSALVFVGNLECIAELIMSGICHRYPKLDFVSAESGFGHIPYMLEALDWQFLNNGCRELYRDWLLPSEYFRRQIYSSFWFESPPEVLLEKYPDNVMFESDYPHPTSLSPGPCSYAKSARETVMESLGGMSESLVRKVLYETATRLYKLDPPPECS